jgi:hypothetical protein
LKNQPGVVGPAQVVWDLLGEDISFSIMDGAMETPLSGGVILSEFVEGEAPASKSQEQDPKWLPKLKDILSDQRDDGEANPAFLKPLMASDSPVLARVHLLGGELKTEQVVKFHEVPVVSHFVPSGKRQALAQKMVFEVNLNTGQEVKIKSTDFTAPLHPIKREIRLAPIGNENIEVTIMNLCCGFHIEKVRAAQGTNIPPEVDEDFEIFYILCKNFSPNDKGEPFGGRYTLLPLPTPVVFPLSTPPAPILSASTPDGGGIDPIRCTMARFNPTI